MINQVRIAVILAAGMGTRLESVTKNKTPKGFININGRTLIDRSISKLKNEGIKKIYIVTGHLSEFYDELAYDDLQIITIKSECYKTKGSMSSLAVLENELKEDFLLLESDIIYEIDALKKTIEYPKEDCVLISGKTKSGDECYIEIRNNNLYKISKDISQIREVFGELVGISKISLKLYKQMLIEYKNNDINQYHYEDAIFDVAKKREIGYLKVENLIWGEIDDIVHLNRIKNNIIPKLLLKHEEEEI
jgi:L-glutamine-phosphate cytidylyltransferase